MISYLEGVLKKVYADKITLGVGGVGYEVLIPGYVMNEIRRTAKTEDTLKLYISFNQSERQPKPVLVGFRTELDKEFFELFISVEDIGPAARNQGADKAGPGDSALHRREGGKGPEAVEGDRGKKGGEDHRCP